MTFEISQLFGVGVLYLLILFGIAYTAEKHWIPERITRHPAVYVLSLGVYATSWSYYGSVGFAQKEGFNFLTIYLGATLAFVLTPVLLAPILRLTREFQLSSLADLFAFRYRSQLVGILVTLFMLAGTLPYIALQIRAVTRSIYVMTQEVAPAEIGLWFCATITVFAILFGARHISPREKHEGLVVAIAFESLVKLLAILGVGLYALFGVFGGTEGLNEWLQVNPEAVHKLYQPVREGPWSTYLLLSFAAAFLLPRQFHMAFTENTNPRALAVASWGFPLFLLAFNLAIPLILWAGTKSQLTTEADYFLLGLTLNSNSPGLALIAFIGGISAASAMMIVTSLALSHMCLNHILLPASYPDPKVDLYRWLLWGRRILIAIILMIGYFFYLVLEHNEGLVQLGLISFVAVAQFLPGIVGLLYWRRANKFGLISGLIGGIAVWCFALLFPLFNQGGLSEYGIDPLELMRTAGQDKWTFATFWSLTVNTLLFTVVSLFTKPSAEEKEAAQACHRDATPIPTGTVSANSPEKFTEQLSQILGRGAAEREITQALDDMDLTWGETRPAKLRLLRDQLERNLSGLVGPHMSRMIVHKRIQMNSKSHTAFADGMRFVEDRLEESRTQLRGLAVELDALRRYHRQVLQDLPLGVCSLGPDKEIVIWNLAMEILSGIDRNNAMGTPIKDLPQPWSEMFSNFIENPDQHRHKLIVQIDGRARWFNLHRAAIIDSFKFDTEHLGQDRSGMVILVEDLTDIQTLESELAHSERLASIGRLAAGVAHEVGNPVTGIACLAQNLKHESEPEIIQESIDEILQQTGRITDIVQTLVTFSHGGTSGGKDLSLFNLHSCADEAARLVQLSHASKQIECQNLIDDDIELQGDRPKLIQVFVNLLTNACDASRPGDLVQIKCSIEDETAYISVKDEGDGIPDSIVDRVYEPFFTTKEPGEGTGLGLPLVYNIVQDHGGSISINSSSDGTSINIRLPLKSNSNKDMTFDA